MQIYYIQFNMWYKLFNVEYMNSNLINNSNLIDHASNQSQFSNRENVNLSLLFESKDLQDTTTHEIIWNELLDFKKRGNAKSTDKSRQEARTKLSDDNARSVISSDNEIQDSSNRRASAITYFKIFNLWKKYLIKLYNLVYCFKWLLLLLALFKNFSIYTI